jgi:DNA-binding response OmpR family regulator
MRLLFVTSSTDLVGFLRPALAAEDVEMLHAQDLDEGLRLLRRKGIGMVVVDATSPDLNGELACQMFRRSKRKFALVVVAEAAGRAYRATDSVMKPPVTVRKLMNRVRKYVHQDDTDLLVAAGLELHIKERRLVCWSGVHRLTAKQCELLAFFMRRPGKTLSRKEIMREVWDTQWFDDTRTLDVHVHWLRKRIEQNTKNPQYIRTVRGVGYRFDAPA